MAKRSRTTKAVREAARPYRLKQAEKLLSLFEDMNKRPARTMEELTQWAISPEGARYLAQFQDADRHIVPD
jgi:hypothetical protein